MKHLLCALLLCALSNCMAVAASVQGFIPNRGQILDQNGHPNEGVLFLMPGATFNAQIHHYGFSYEAWSPGEKENELRSYRIDVIFEGASGNASWETGEEAGTWLHYYNIPGHPEGIEYVKPVKRLYCRGLYPGIDLEFIAEGPGQAMEYNFLVEPGADLSQIRMKYSGAELSREGEDLLLCFSGGQYRERIPASWFDTGSSKIAVNIGWEIFDKNTAGLAPVGDSDWLCDAALVVDPTAILEWGRYFGGNEAEQAGFVSPDGFGNFYHAGITRSTTNIATAGAHDVIYSANGDAYISELNSTGDLTWASYLGGTGREVLHALESDHLANAFIAGYTNSSSGIGTAQSEQPGKFIPASSDYDAFLVKFNSSGVRQWGTYLGGSADDWAYDIASTTNGDIILAGSTESGGLAEGIGIQLDLFGESDALLVRFDGNMGTADWIGYYGGLGEEQAFGIAVSDDDFIIAGRTTSASAIATAGTHDQSFDGPDDGFIAKFNASGQRIWGTYYGGENDYNNDVLPELAEYLMDVAVDNSGSIFVAGISNAWEDSGLNFGPAGLDNTQVNGRFEFYTTCLAKFNSDGSGEWGGYYFPSSRGYYILGAVDKTTCIDIDSGGNIILGGSTFPIAPPPVNNNIEFEFINDIDVFLASFNQNGSELWNIEYGGVEIEWINSLACLENEEFIISGCTESESNIAENSEDTQYDGLSDSYLARFYLGDVPGCTDPAACNYSPNASLNDGSCFYCNETCGYVTLYPDPFWECQGFFDLTFRIYEQSTFDIVFTLPITLNQCENLEGPEYHYFCVPDGCYVYELVEDNLAYGLQYSIHWGGEEILSKKPFYMQLSGDIILGEPVSGCTDPSACNFNPLATCNDLCTYPGCTNPNACNYSLFAGCDDGTCSYPGCIDPLADNYNILAGCDNGSCCYANNLTMIMSESNPFIAGWGGATYVISDAYGNVVRSGTLAVNANGSQSFCIGDGCFSLWINPGANPNISWTLTGANEALSGSFLVVPLQFTVGDEIITGCADPEACNYLPEANCIDQSLCTYPGCTIPSACNYDPDAGCDDDSCQPSGCTDPEAQNYNPLAQCDNGSCCPGSTAILTMQSLNFFNPGWDGAFYFFTDVHGTVLATGTLAANLFSQTVTICLPDGCLNFSVSNGANPLIFWTLQLAPGGIFSGAANASIDIYSGQPVGGCLDPLACNYDPLANCDSNNCRYPGCTNPDACNFDPDALCDSGNCDVADEDGDGIPDCFDICSGFPDNLDSDGDDIPDGCDPCPFDAGANIPGCTDSQACNYDPSATCDNGSCDYACSCPGDFNYDGSINTSDVLLLLANFGCVQDCGIYDLTEDDSVTTSDMLFMLSVFGTDCP